MWLLWRWRLKALAVFFIHAFSVVFVLTTAAAIGVYAFCLILTFTASGFLTIGLQPLGLVSRATFAMVIVLFLWLRFSQGVRDRYWPVLHAGEKERKVLAALSSRSSKDPGRSEGVELVPFHDRPVGLAARLSIGLYRRRVLLRAIWRIGAEAVAPVFALLVSTCRSITLDELRRYFPDEDDLGRVLLCLCAISGIRLERRGARYYVCLSSKRLLMLMRKCGTFPRRVRSGRPGRQAPIPAGRQAAPACARRTRGLRAERSAPSFKTPAPCGGT